jgi:hypothetical protein
MLHPRWVNCLATAGRAGNRVDAGPGGALLGPPRTIQDVNVPRTARAVARIITGTKSTISRLLNFTSGAPRRLCHLFAFTAGSAGPLSNSAFIAWRRRYASRSRMVFAGRLRLAEINTHDFPASIKSNNRRSSSGVQLLWRRAAPIIVLPNLVPKSWRSAPSCRFFVAPAGFPFSQRLIWR